jgi:hypothetical protein
MKRKDFIVDFPEEATRHYLIVDSLEEVYENLVLIKKELGR